MLSDAKLRNLKPGPRAYKVVDRDGLYAMVLASDVVSFRYNYSINGRQETLVIGRYGSGGLSLAEAREKLDVARKLVATGMSPSQHKRRQKQRREGEETFGQWAERWLENYRMAESTRDMRRAVYERDLHRPFGRQLLHEITHEELRALCDAIVARGAPATAVHAREIVMLAFRYAGQRGHEHPNPADQVPPCSIATFQPRDRALSATEIPWLYEHLERVQSAPTLRLAVKLLLLTMVRKSELTDATWDEINFTSGIWTIPAERMKRRNPHNVYLSRQAADMFIALRTCAGGSRYVLPSRYDADLPISNAMLKIPDGAFSRGVSKVADASQFHSVALE
jgi:integrase